MGSVEKSQEELDNAKVERYLDEFFDQYVDLYMLRVQEFWGKLQQFYTTEEGGFLRELFDLKSSKNKWNEHDWAEAIDKLESESTTGVEGNGRFAFPTQASGKDTLKNINRDCFGKLLEAVKSAQDKSISTWINGLGQQDGKPQKQQDEKSNSNTPRALTLELLMVCLPYKYPSLFSPTAYKCGVEAIVRMDEKNNGALEQQNALSAWLLRQHGRCFQCRIERYDSESNYTFKFVKPDDNCMDEMQYKAYFVRQMLIEFVSWLGAGIESKEQFDEEIEKKRALVEAEHNIVLHGAPGTGKTYMARGIAAKIIGCSMEVLGSSDQFGFVQFHPSYDYTDFVEGLRPVSRPARGSVDFRLQGGAFKEFCGRARKAWEGALEEAQEKHEDKSAKEIRNEAMEKADKYVFVIDEINRGDISKVFGELFFSIDPGYRGEDGSVSTQYDNMRPASRRGFHVPPNVYVIGTMNDIDRSVDSFDYAMRRRFKFVEVKPEDTQDFILKGPRKDYAEKVMEELNEKVRKDLGSQYELGASYFKDYASGREAAFDLWDYSLEPLLREYIEEAGMVADAEIGGYRDIYGYWVLGYENCGKSARRGEKARGWLKAVNGAIDKTDDDPAVRNKAKIDARFFIDYIERGFGFEEEDYKFIQGEIEGHIIAADLKVEAVPKLDKAIKEICQKEGSTNQASYWKSKNGVR